MVSLTALHNSAGSLRPQGLMSKAEISPKSTTLDVASVSDVARPHRGAGRSVNRTAELTTEGRTSDAGAETAEPCLVRSPSGSKLVNPDTGFPFGACFTFWLRRGGGRSQDPLEELGSATEVMDFWKYWNGIVLDRLPAGSLLAVFRHPDRPRVGPKAPGGKWVMLPTRTQAVSLFEELALALVGGEFDEASEGAPCGVAFFKGEKTQIEVWNRCSDDSATEPVLTKLRELVGNEVEIEYCPHRVAGGASPKKGQDSPTNR